MQGIRPFTNPGRHLSSQPNLLSKPSRKQRYVGDHGKIQICDSDEKRVLLLEQGYQLTQGGFLVRGLLGGCNPQPVDEKGNLAITELYRSKLMPEFEKGIAQLGSTFSERVDNEEDVSKRKHFPVSII